MTSKLPIVLATCLLALAGSSVAPEPPEIREPHLWPGLSSHPILIGYDKQIIHHRAHLDDSQKPLYDQQASRLRFKLLEQMSRERRPEGSLGAFQTVSGRNLIPHLRGVGQHQGPLRVIFSVPKQERSSHQSSSALSLGIELPSPGRGGSARAAARANQAPPKLQTHTSEEHQLHIPEDDEGLPHVPL